MEKISLIDSLDKKEKLPSLQCWMRWWQEKIKG
jgi:hypothetical protein